MRKVLALILALVLTLTLFGCKQELPLSQEEKEYYESLLRPYEYAIPIDKDYAWEKAEEISSDRLLDFYYKNEFLNYFEKQHAEYGEVVEQNPIMRVPASEVEGYIQKYFNVDESHLRKSLNFDYNPTDNTYGFKIEGGFGGLYGVVVKKVVKNGNVLDIYCTGGNDYETKDTMIIRIEIKRNNLYKFICATQQ